MTEMLLYLYAESPVHAGAADSLGVLDLPVQREATTNYPVIWGQSLKGALRQAAEEAEYWSPGAVTAVFGPEIERSGGGGGRELSAGLVSVGDAQLVAMPVPTLQQTFAWVTSHLALNRLARKYAHLPQEYRSVPATPVPAADAGAASSETWVATGQSREEVLGPCLVDLGTRVDTSLAEWADRLAIDVLGGDGPLHDMADRLRSNLLLVGADVMPTLLTECTEFVARVQLSADKTVQQGPFHCEYLPAETILAASLTLRSGRDRPESDHAGNVDLIRRLLGDALIQVGGDETIGKGLVWTRLIGLSGTGGNQPGAAA